MIEQKIVKVVFNFEDGSEKVVEGKELGQWRAILSNYSDYFLPGAHDMILGVLEGFPARVEGFIPPSALGKPTDSQGLKWVRYEEYYKR